MPRISDRVISFRPGVVEAHATASPEAGRGMTALPSGDRLQPRGISAGPMAPRATFPGPGMDRGVAESVAMAPGPREITPLPPLPEFPSRNRLAERGPRREAYAQLCQDYNRSTCQDLSLQAFVKEVFRRTGHLPTKAFTTATPGITHFVLQLEGRTGSVHVLRRDTADGHLADMRPIASDAGDVMAQALQEMQRAASVSAGMKVADDVGKPSHSARRTKVSDKDFHEAFMAFKNVRGNENTSRLTFQKMLCTLANEAGPGIETSHAGIERFTLHVPKCDKTVTALGIRGADGKVADIREAPQEKKAEGWVVDRLRDFRAASASKKIVQRARDEATLHKHRLISQADAVRDHFKEEYETWRLHQAAQGTSAAPRIDYGRRAYAAHLLQLCDQPGDDTKAQITRHEIVADDGRNTAMTVLALRGDDGRAIHALKVGAGKAEADVRKALLTYARTSEASLMSWSRIESRPKAEPQTAVQAAAKTPASDPQASLASQLTSTTEMLQALDQMQRNKAEGKWFLHGVPEATGVSERAFRSWFKSDGTLRRSPAMLRAGLKGYYNTRDALQGAFERLGLHETAAKLPLRMNAELLVKLLEAKLQARGQGHALSKQLLAETLKVPPTEIRYLVDPTGKLVFNNGTIRHYPGYAAQYDRIRSLLQQLGETGRAKLLARPATAGEQVALSINQNFYFLESALRLMRSDRALSLDEAAKRTDAPPDLLKAVVADDGTVHDFDDVRKRLLEIGPQVLGPEDAAQVHDTAAFRQQLEHWDEVAKRDLDKVLRRLQRHSPPMKQLNEEAKRNLGKVLQRLQDPSLPMKTTRLRKFPVDLLFVTRNGAGPREEVTTVKSIYGHNPKLVRVPRSFREERARQTLRWLSTVLKRKFPDAVEIQAYYDRDKRTIWVSSNCTEVNVALRSFLRKGGLAEYFGKPPGSHETRTDRHAWKLHKALQPSAKQHPDELARNVLAAISSASFRVPDEDVYENGRSVNLHAERRIKRALMAQPGDKAMSLNLLAGTMRPCGICADDLGYPNFVPRGPFWLSRPAQAFADMPKVVESNATHAVQTSITLSKRNHKLTFSHDTDSDSDADVPLRNARNGKTKAAEQPPAPAPKRAAAQGPDGRPRPMQRPVQPAASAIDAQAARPAGSQNEQQASLDSLSEAAGHARALLASLGVELSGVSALPLREQTSLLLDKLLDEGRQQFMQVLRAKPGSPEEHPSTHIKDRLESIAKSCAELRRHPEALPEHAKPTSSLPAGVPQDGTWTREQMRQAFEPGQASADGNICWFDTMAQLWLGDDRRDDGPSRKTLDDAARRLRQACDRLGVSQPGKMFDHDHPMVQVMARALDLQVHAFHQFGDGTVSLHPVNSAGSPSSSRHVHVYLSGQHFVPLWPRKAGSETAQ